MKSGRTIWKSSLHAAASRYTPVSYTHLDVYKRQSLEQIREYCRQQVDTLWDEVKRFDYPHKYYVVLSPKLWQIQQDLLRAKR